jgi:hypothetical protein
VLADSIIKAIALMMEAASTSETWVNFYQTTRRNIPKDTRVHTRRRENLKSHFLILSFSSSNIRPHFVLKQRVHAATSAWY